MPDYHRRSRIDFEKLVKELSVTENNGAIGVVLAAGLGLRFCSDKPKQFHNLAGRMIVEYPIEAYVAHSGIDEVIVVHPEGFDSEVQTLRRKFGNRKPIRFVSGSGTRPGSTRAVLNSIGSSEARRKILFHDAVRPFLTREIIDRCLAALDNFEAVDTVVPAVDTVVMLDERSEWLEAIPPRARLRRGQTPQGFWLHRIVEAYSVLEDDQLGHFTDDCGVLLARFPEVKIAVVDGHENNIKITSPLDMFLAEQLMYTGHNEEPQSPERVQEKTVAVLFGGTSGLGFATAQRMSSLGWTVEVASRSTGVDIRDLDAVRGFLEQTKNTHGRIDLIANFAGILQVGRLEEMDLATIDEVLSINLVGSILVSQASLPYLAATRGHLVLTSSSSYYRGRANTAVYSASKAAVVNLTQALAEEWVQQGVSVSCVVPRRADTPMRRNAFPEEDQAANLKPERVADTILELHQKNQTGIVRHVY